MSSRISPSQFANIVRANALSSLLLCALTACYSTTERHDRPDAKAPEDEPDAAQQDPSAREEPPPPVDMGDEDPDDLFDPDRIHTFELRIDEEDLAFLDQDPKAEEYVRGDLTFEGKRVGPVGVRYKGSTGSFVGCLSGSYFPPTGSKTCTKLSMKIKIDYADDDAKFYGQKKLLFHAMNSDRSLMRERLGYGVYREAGVKASRTAHMRLLINGELNGLYLLVEEVDGRFTRGRFDDGGKGNLYKEVWPLHESEERYRIALESNQSDDVPSDKMIGFAQALRAADDASLPSVLETWLDTDYTTRVIAIDRAIRADDGPYHWYCTQGMDVGDHWGLQTKAGNYACGNHNYYWYQDSEADRLWLIPWDLDGSMPNMRIGYTTILTRWDDVAKSCAAPQQGVGNSQLPSTCDPLLRGVALGYADRVRAHMQELIDGPLSAEAVDEKLDRWADQIEPVVDEVSALYPREPSVTAFRNEVATLKRTLGRLRGEALATPPAPDAGIDHEPDPDPEPEPTDEDAGAGELDGAAPLFLAR
ncbi:MAG TPA: CotH kinase family protein [Polyangiales bacterium]